MNPVTQFIRDSLNIKHTDYFASYGMGSTARKVVDEVRDLADVSSGIALDNVEFEESSAIRTVIYKGMVEFGAKKLFDKVYCDFQSLPRTYKDLPRCFGACYDLCTEKGMVLIEGITNRKQAHHLLEQKHITKFWLLRDNDSHFDLLYIKEKHFEA